MKGSSASGRRGLMVLADGVHAAFAAGAVAALARRGVRWDRGAGAGLGAQVALLGLLGDAEEAERRWARQGELGCPMFESRVGAARRRVAAVAGVTVLTDAGSAPGWLDPAGLAEHLEPESADVPRRLAARGASLNVAVEDAGSGTRAWCDLARVAAARAGALLRAAAAFPGGWGPEEVREGERSERLWGGTSAALQGAPPWGPGSGEWDAVCGFPVPASPRSALGGSLLELIQRRSEIECAAWVASLGECRIAVVAPTASEYEAWSGRPGADLGVEYPLPWERNGALTAALVRFGAFAAGERGAKPPE